MLQPGITAHDAFAMLARILSTASLYNVYISTALQKKPETVFIEELSIQLN